MTGTMVQHHAECSLLAKTFLRRTGYMQGGFGEEWKKEEAEYTMDDKGKMKNREKNKKIGVMWKGRLDLKETCIDKG